MSHLPPPSSDLQEQVLQPDGHRYTIAIPHGCGDRAMPLVLALHYGGDVTPFYGKGILTRLVEPALRGLEALIVAPDCIASDWIDLQSETAVLRLLDHIQDSYTIDPKRMLITGYSKGGKGTWYLASRHQERFAAALVMAATPQVDTVDVEWEIPLYVIHSRKDELFSLESTEAVVKQLQAKGVSVEMVVVEGIGHYETDRFTEPLRAAVPWIEKAWA